MSLDRILDKEPQQFEIYQRIMGYVIIGLLVVIYYFTSPLASYQIYFPIFLLLIFLVSPKLSRWIQYKFDSHIRKNVYFLIDVVVVASALAAVHLSLVVTFVLLFALIHTGINSKISFMIGALSCLIAIIIFYINIIFIFGFEDYFQQTTPELTIVASVSIILFVSVGNY